MRSRRAIITASITAALSLALFSPALAAPGGKSGGGGGGKPCKTCTTATSDTTSTTTPTSTSTTSTSTTSTTSTTTVAEPEPTAPEPEPTTTEPAPAPAGDASVAPDTQGTWVSPEGVSIEVNTAGPFTIRRVYALLLENAAGPGDFARVAPSFRVRVQDTYASQVSMTARTSGGVYTSVSGTMWLKGVSSGFASQPDSTMAHEYGHVWTMYHLYMTQQGNWSAYLDYRWANADGSVRLSADSRLDSTYSWERGEVIGDDYRLLFGSPTAISQRPTHMNTAIPEPSEVPGLKAFFQSTWA